MGLPVGTYSPFRISLRDKSNEVGSFSAYGFLLTAENFAAQLALATTFRQKLEAITLGVTTQMEYGILTVVDPVSLPVSPSAQRENKLLVRYHDAVTLKVMTATIPTISLPSLVFLTDANDFVDLTTPSFMSGLVTAWEDFVTNPETGNLTIIDSAQFVGRNR